MSIQKLTSENAIIKTASVEVKTLTISGKQVTLAVFRQLPARDIISDEGPALKGVPWGTVNYHPDKCSEEAEHIHVVWREGSILARSITAKKPDWDHPALLRRNRLFSAYVDALIANAKKPIFLSDSSEGHIDIGAFWRRVCFEGEWYRVPMPDRTTLVKNARKKWEDNGSPPVDTFYSPLRHAIQANERWLASYDSLYEQLKELDQLFIAV
jgi:hypothetical protein